MNAMAAIRKQSWQTRLYRTRENLAFCREYGIRLSGPPLGRPPLDSRQDKRIERQDIKDRNAVEGGFGVCKRRYGLARIMARLKETAESIISQVHGNELGTPAPASLLPFSLRHLGDIFTA